MEVDAVAEETQKEGTDNAQAEKNTVKLPAPKPHDPVKKPRREDRNRKDDKNLEQFTKAINTAPNPEEKLAIASQKYAQMLEDNKKMQFYIKQSDKRHALILKEKEQLQLEFNKTILLKSKLENLCRELQKQNKSIKDESLHKIREEEERRKETQTKFQTTLAEISTLLQQNNEKNSKLRDDNISMTEKFKTVVQQYQLREDQVEKMSKQMDLETQLNAAKMQKASLEHQAEKEQLLAEMEQLKAAVLEYRARVNQMQNTETDLRGQLAVYTDKYDEFQSALMKSNQVFGGFKEQMEKMSKTIKKLQKESLSWKQRWESSQSALLDMCGERQACDARLLCVQRQLAHMQSLCRTLQAERTVLLGTLKEHNIERPPLPAPAPPPPPPPAPAPAPAHSAASDAKVDAMAANCAQLRQSLAHLQSQLNVLTTQQTQQAEEAQQEKPKKSKNKKNKSKKVKEETTEESSTNEDKSEDVTPNAVIQKVDGTDNTTNQTDNATAETENATAETENATAETENATAETENATAGTENATANTDDATAESVDLAVDKVDEKALESLMEVINIVNVSLCNVQVNGDDEVKEVLDDSQTEIKPESSEKQIETHKVNQETVGTPKKVETPKTSPKKAQQSANASPKKTKKASEPVTIAEVVSETTKTVAATTEPADTSDAKQEAIDLPELVPVTPESNTTPVDFSQPKPNVETAQTKA